MQQSRMIRQAVADDVPQMVALSAAKRIEYQAYAPTFWRMAEDASEKHAPFLASQISEESAICLVNEFGGKITGFIIAKITAAPPVYDPGSLVCIIDDF